MSTHSEIQIRPTPEYETWRVDPRPSAHKENSIIHPDAIAGLVRPVKFWGLAAVDVLTADIVRAQRTASDTHRDGMNDYKLLFQVSGSSTLIQDERATELAEGDFGLIDVARPINLVSHQGPGRWIGLHLPRQPLKANLGFEPHGGLCWRGDTLPGRLLLRLILDAIDESDIVLGSAEPFMQSAVYDLVGALFGGSELPRHFSQSDKLFVRICSIVKCHFPDPDIGPAEVATEAGISVRYLQKIFAMRGTTCSHYIRSVRLDHAAHLLDCQISTKRNIPLAEIGQCCGYRDYANFARHFRARFGYTPGAFRKRAPSQ